jgi:hypothetical protein
MNAAQLILRIADKTKKIFDTLQFQGSLIRVIDKFLVINETLEVFYCLKVGHRPARKETVNV